jgi:hypothetical protein
VVGSPLWLQQPPQLRRSASESSPASPLFGASEEGGQDRIGSGPSRSASFRPSASRL